jgi:hypothetical protein
VTPSYDHKVVFSCNFELDSFAAFLQISYDYYNATGDANFFSKFQWIAAVQSLLAVSTDMMAPSYDIDGSPLQSPYTFSVQTTTAAGTLWNGGLGNPVNRTGLIRSPFRPSDDSGLFQFLIPANAMLARYLEACAEIMALLPNAPSELAKQMSDMAASLRDAINMYGIVPSPLDRNAMIYAYEVDGYGGRNLMDDANIPSLLSLPFIGYLDRDDPIYRSTRDFVLSNLNPWFSRGSVISAVGSPHVRPGTAWPMASIVRIMTSDDDAEILLQLKEILGSTDGLGLIHESIESIDQSNWSRQWLEPHSISLNLEYVANSRIRFSWANGLFGAMILDLEANKPQILAQNFQPYHMA